MTLWKKIKFNLIQIYAIAEKDIKISLRIKVNVVMGYITPFIAILLPLIVMNKFYETNDNFGPWTRENYYIYLFMGYIIILIQRIVNEYNAQFAQEKFWNTLEALMVAPFNKYNLLFGTIISHLLMVSVPIILFYVLCYIILPISIFTILFIILITFAILLVFAGIGMIVGVFAISNESIRRMILFGLQLIFFVSCITYPFQIFPSFIQSIISLNPFYYILDLLRLSWIENDAIYTINTHPVHIIILIVLVIIMPFIGVIMFNYIFKKYGIVGY